MQIFLLRNNRLLSKECLQNRKNLYGRILQKQLKRVLDLLHAESAMYMVMLVTTMDQLRSVYIK